VKILTMKSNGFSLLELMIVIAVIAITLAWAVPSYNESVRKARRGEAQAQMREVEVCAARSFTVNSNFGNVAGDCDLDVEEDYYTFTIADDALSYTVTATPQGSQAGDKCGTMTLTQTGAATAAAVGCWASNQVSS
jgi:type IV pilus assembly protein PilE